MEYSDDGKDLMDNRKPYKASKPKYRGCGTVRMPQLQMPTFRAAKQWFKQKVGAADRTQEPEEFQSELKHLERIDAYLKSVFLHSKRAVEKWQTALTASEKFLETCLESKVEEVDGSARPVGVKRLTKFADAMDLLVEQDDLLNQNMIKFQKLHAELLKDQLERVVASEAQDAVKARAAYYNAVLDYDACRTNLAYAEKRIHKSEGPPNVAHAKEHLRISQIAYENKKRGLLNAIKHLNHVIETDVAEAIDNYTSNKKRSFLSLESALNELHLSYERTRETKRQYAKAQESDKQVDNKPIERPPNTTVVEVKDSATKSDNQNIEADPVPGLYDVYSSTMERRY